jgi:hypothetical protein
MTEIRPPSGRDDVHIWRRTDRCEVVTLVACNPDLDGGTVTVISVSTLIDTVG